MRMERVVEGGWPGLMLSHCRDRCFFLFIKFCRHLEKHVFPFPLTPAEWIGNVQLKRQGGAKCSPHFSFFSVCITKNLGVTGKVQQSIVGTVTVAPIYWWKNASSTNGWRVTNIFQICKISQIFFMSAAPLHWCKMVISTNILVHYKINKMLSPPSLSSWRLPIHSKESGKRFRFHTRWLQN